MYFVLAAGKFCKIANLNARLANPNINRYELCRNKRHHLQPVVISAGAMDYADERTDRDW